MPWKASYAASLTCIVLRSLVMAVATLATFSEAVVSRCPDGQFFSTSARSCLACALCPKNLIIRVPCNPHSDTICGPFFEFYEFHQAPRPTLHDSDFLQDESSQQNVDLAHNPHVNDPTSDPTHGGQFEEESLPPGESAAQNPTQDVSEGQGTRHFQDLEYLLPGEGKAGDEVERSPSWEGSLDRPRVQTPEEEEERQWKVLALALIIVLCVFCIMLVLFIFIVCYFRASRSHRKAALWSSAQDSRSERRGAGSPRYFPLPFWAHTQIPASAPGERSHTAGMTTSGDRPVMVADRGTVQGGTAGSEYVYFKSPQNGNGEAVDV